MTNEFTIGLTAIFIVWMLILTFLDQRSFNALKHRDYKSIIVSIGVLGTFVGIIIGLWHFDTTSIKNSVPFLLEGLKTAFITSVTGMFLSITLSIFQKSKDYAETEDELSALNAISVKLDKLYLLERLEKLNSLDNLKHLEILPLMNTKFDSIDTNIKVLSSDISSVKEELRINQSQLFEFLEKSLKEISFSLDEALEKLAEGANKEIIKALESVIQDFNNNLTEQFGDNFKQLNESVKNMIIWQEEHKNNILSMQEILTKSADQAQQSFKEIQNSSVSIVNMTDKYERIAEVSSKLESIININENQINNIEAHLKSLKNLGDDAKDVVASVNEFSKVVQGSLSQQSQTLTDLTKELEKQVPQSIDQLNKALTSIVTQFVNDYEGFLGNATKMMRTANRVA